MNQLTNKILAYTITGPGIQPNNTSAGSAPQIEKIISSVLGFLTILAVIFFTIQIILAGFSLMASQGDPKELETGKKRLTNNVMGLAIVIVAYGLGALIAKLFGINDVFNLTRIFAPIQ